MTSPDFMILFVAERGVRIEHPPADVEFGRTFLARDPDGHRLRVLNPS